MASNVVPEAKAALNKFKYEVASEIGVPLKQGYNGDLTSAQNGSVGGYMVNIISPKQHKTFPRQQGMRNWAESWVCYTYGVGFA
ncbi:MAG: alpha/beta-type small acid-soluble spore protein [Defluviitaleaceae bacterium]|nr:alpha/beta-type small acid-soluble spore protein [Defluviitaleaceae bacterium]